MPVFKATILFRESGAGWSESFYKNSDEFKQFAKEAVVMANRRLNCSPPTVSCLGIRITSPGQFRWVRFVLPGVDYTPTLPIGAGAGNVPTLNAIGFFNIVGLPPPPPIAVQRQAIEPTVALLIRMEATQAFRRMFLMRGLPETIVDTNNDYNPAAPGWDGNISVFSSIMRGTSAVPDAGGPWSVLGQTLNPAGVDPMANVQTLDGHTLKITGQTPASLAVGLPQPTTPPTFVDVKGIRNAHGANGVWKVLDYIPGVIGPPATPFTLLLGKTATHIIALPPETNLTNARVFARTVALVNIDTFAPERIAERRVGRPFGLPHGRSSPHR